MSEAELHVLRTRMREGALHKVAKGQLRISLPTGYDYDELEQIAERERPKLIIGGGSAYSRIIDFARMRQIADKIGAKYMVDMAHFAGLVAGGAHPSPVPHCHVVTSTTHKTLRGPRAGMVLCKQDLATALEVGLARADAVGNAGTCS